MAHKHSVYDSDKHFSINTITRAIQNESFPKKWLVQNDHNSERFTFELQRFIEGHDMSLCDKIEIHYINISANTTEQSADVYPVDDMQISPDSENVVIFSWLISGNATKYAGTLNFLIRFVCLDGETIEYAWNTAVFDDITIASGMNNGEMVIAEYSDVLEAWLEANKAEWDLIAKETTQAWMENHPEAIEQATDKWLNEHPEVTTTVQDGSLTKEKFTDNLKLATIKDYITPQMYGAVGDGVTDDSDAFQACFDNSAGKLIVIPNAKYRLYKAIKLRPSIYAYSIRGMTDVIEAYFASEKITEKDKFPNIQCDSHFLDGTNDEGYTELFCLNIKNLSVSFSYDNPHTVVKNFLNNVDLGMGVIKNCCVTNADSIFKGAMGGRSIVDGCFFAGIRRSLLLDGDFPMDTIFGFWESNISNCYINGNRQEHNAQMVTSHSLHKMVFINCYCDFFKIIVGRDFDDTIGANFDGTIFQACTFDIGWRVVAGHHDVTTPLVFDNCIFMRYDENSIKSYFLKPDGDMLLDDGTYTKCGVIINDTALNSNSSIAIKQNTISNVRITNCRLETVDYPIYLSSQAWTHQNIVEKGNTFVGYKGDSPVTFHVWGAGKYLKTIYFESLNGKDHTTLPMCQPTGDDAEGNASAFEGMTIFYNGKPAILHNYQWIDYAGNVLT